MGKKKGKIFAFIIMFFIGLFFGFLSGVVFGKNISEANGTGELLLIIAVLLIFIFVSYFLQIFIHELGHLVCGLLSGYSFSSFRIGSFMLIKKDNKFKIKRFSIMGTGGQCLMVPPELDNGFIPYKLYNFGGVLFNLIFSIISLILYNLTKDTSIFSFLFFVTALLGLSFFLLNGIPLNLGNITNDGYNVFSLGKNKEAIKALWINLKINDLNTKGIRLKDMPEEWFYIPSNEGLNNSLISSIGVFKCNREMDSMNFSLAAELASELLNKETAVIGIYKNVLRLDLMFCELIGENNKEKIDSYFTKDFVNFQNAMAKNLSVIRTQYAYELLSNNDEPSANKKLELFNKISKNHPYDVDIESEKELIDYAYNIYKKSSVTLT